MAGFAFLYFLAQPISGCKSVIEAAIENLDGLFGSVGGEAFASFLLRFAESFVA